MFKKFQKIKNNKGMTLIELMVVLAIFVIVSGIVIFDYGSFRSTVSLQNLADDMALSIRRAQNYAIGVHNSQVSGVSGFRNGYGIHFSTNATPASPVEGSNRSFILFNDLPGSSGENPNRSYDHDSSVFSCDQSLLGPGNECIDLLTINTGDEIQAICPNNIESTCDRGSVDIVFVRPNPDAIICATMTYSGSSVCDGPLSSVGIRIRDPQTDRRKVITVSNTGQISIQ